ncbi:hypothetical protein [Streptomyces cucumeris]|uniref:hypothetical protein n=1 Tax=Streptomyces cucumeris TaxID=2962890 RepID=UPI0020C87967|nr:hypothetical protein [Streptomyces sp. NEAU-Y11]MCP9208760.1 hypothetical protein [Streptomyces sp. NEAU-Y11]
MDDVLVAETFYGFYFGLLHVDSHAVEDLRARGAHAGHTGEADASEELRIPHDRDLGIRRLGADSHPFRRRSDR